MNLKMAFLMVIAATVGMADVSEACCRRVMSSCSTSRRTFSTSNCRNKASRCSRSKCTRKISCKKTIESCGVSRRKTPAAAFFCGGKSSCGSKNACAAKRPSVSKAACGSQRVGGGCCKTQWTLQTHAQARDLPPDLANLPENSFRRMKFDKMFNLIPKSIRNWQEKKYAKRMAFYKSEQWEKAKADLSAKLKDMGTKMGYAPVVTEREVLTLAEEMVVYGRGLTRGTFQNPPTFRELAKDYGFENVEKFLKKALDIDRFRHTGMAADYPDNLAEFRDFDTLARNLFPEDWAACRNTWRDLNRMHKEIQYAQKAADKRTKRNTKS